MHKRKRFRLILAAAEAQGIVTVQEMMERLGASSATVRRDISELAKARELYKVHGGAEALGHTQRSGMRQFSLDYANATSLRQKIAIADKAVSLCSDDESVIINGGSTTYQMVHALQNRTMQVLTNSLPIAAYLFAHSNVRLQVPGGEVYRDQHIILSPFDNDTIRNYSASKLFMGASCLNRSGLLESDPRLIQAERKILSQASELIVLIDSSKFTGVGSLILCPLTDIDTVICDDGIRDEDRQMLDDAGVSLLIANISDVKVA
jgi:DeoR family ulaG and ulaABCDEF operon transcriptional repressor